MFSLQSNGSTWGYNPDFMFILTHKITKDHLTLPDAGLHTFSSNVVVTLLCVIHSKKRPDKAKAINSC